MPRPKNSGTLALSFAQQGRFALALESLMTKRGMVATQLASASGLTYGYVRRLLRGEMFPGRDATAALGRALRLGREQVEELALLVLYDRIAVDFGPVAYAALGQHPELGELEAAWDALTAEQKEFFKFQIRAAAEYNRRRRRRPAK